MLSNLKEEGIIPHKSETIPFCRNKVLLERYVYRDDLTIINLTVCRYTNTDIHLISVSFHDGLLILIVETRTFTLADLLG